MEVSLSSALQNNYITRSRKTDTKVVAETELSEVEKLEAFKTEIWNEINRMPRCDSINFSIQITDAGFKRMMEEPAFKEKIMAVLAQEAAVARPPVTSSMSRVDENGHTGCSYNFGYGEEALEVHSNDKDSFYKKKATKKVDYEKLWDEQRLERKQQQEKMNKEYYNSLVEKRRYSQKQTVATLYEKGTFSI